MNFPYGCLLKRDQTLAGLSYSFPPISFVFFHSLACIFTLSLFSLVVPAAEQEGWLEGGQISLQIISLQHTLVSEQPDSVCHLLCSPGIVSWRWYCWWISSLPRRVVHKVFISTLILKEKLSEANNTPMNDVVKAHANSKHPLPKNINLWRNSISSCSFLIGTWSPKYFHIEKFAPRFDTACLKAPSWYLSWPRPSEVHVDTKRRVSTVWIYGSDGLRVRHDDLRGLF